MKKAKVHALLEREKRSARAEGVAQGARQVREQYQREYERVVALPKALPGSPRSLVIGTEPKERFYRFLIGPDMPSWVTDQTDWASARYAEEVVFRAVRQCYQLHTGQVVTWWTWELAR